MRSLYFTAEKIRFRWQIFYCGFIICQMLFFLPSRRIMTINHQTHHYQRHRKFNICEISLSSKRCKRERLFSNWCRFVSNWSAKRMHVLKHRCVLILVLFIQRISHHKILMLVSFGCLFVFFFSSPSARIKSNLPSVFQMLCTFRQERSNYYSKIESYWSIWLL